jgi:hypothetical protein
LSRRRNEPSTPIELKELEELVASIAPAKTELAVRYGLPRRNGWYQYCLLHPDVDAAYERGMTRFRETLRGWQQARATHEAGGGHGCTMLIWLGKQHLDQRDQPRVVDIDDECLIIGPDGKARIERAGTGEEIPITPGEVQ